MVIAQISKSQKKSAYTIDKRLVSLDNKERLNKGKEKRAENQSVEFIF